MRISRWISVLTLAALALMLGLGAQAEAKKRVLILVTSTDRFPSGAPTGMWLEEFAVPYLMLQRQGYAITVASPKGGLAPIDPRSLSKGAQAEQWTEAMAAREKTTPLADLAVAQDFDAVYIPGGHGPLYDLATDKRSIALIEAFARAGKPIASVCHGPAALVGVKLPNGEPLVKGRRVTAFSDAEERGGEAAFSVEQRLKSLGGLYSQGPDYQSYAVQDGDLILGQNPASSARVAELLIERLEAAAK